MITQGTQVQEMQEMYLSDWKEVEPRSTPPLLHLVVNSQGGDCTSLELLLVVGRGLNQLSFLFSFLLICCCSVVPVSHFKPLLLSFFCHTVTFRNGFV